MHEAETRFKTEAKTPGNGRGNPRSPEERRSGARDGGAWGEYFHRRHYDRSSGVARRLDYSNDRVRFQTYSALMEAAGPLTGIRCLDAGCGFGDLARILEAAGANVDAFDVVADTIQSLKSVYPHIRWFTADVANLGAFEFERPYDLVVAAEVLQYTDPDAAIRSLFRLVAPRGRLVGCVPHSGCPVIAAAEGRYLGRYCGVSIPGLMRTLVSLPGVSRLGWRGAVFLEDQSLFPYRYTPWRITAEPDPSDGTPNRLLFIASRA